VEIDNITFEIDQNGKCIRDCPSDRVLEKLGIKNNK